MLEAKVWCKWEYLEWYERDNFFFFLKNIQMVTFNQIQGLGNAQELLNMYFIIFILKFSAFKLLLVSLEVS